MDLFTYSKDVMPLTVCICVFEQDLMKFSGNIDSTTSD